MTEREIDDALGALRATLRVEPSPAFAAGVRARIEREPRHGWATWLAWSAASAVVVIGIVLGWRSASGPTNGSVVANAVPSGAPATVGTSAASAAAIVAPAHVVAPRGAGSGAGVAGPTPSRVVRASQKRVFEVLVPADQRLALTKLLADLDSGLVEGAALIAKPIEPAPPSPPPTDLVIAPIEIPAIGGGGGVIK